MATSPEYVRLATNSARTLADSALDSLRDGVLVIDARHKHFPVVLANAAARLCLTGEPSALGLVESSLHGWLGLDSASRVESVLSALPGASSPAFSGVDPPTVRLVWRFAAGERSVATDIRPLASAAGQQLVMLTFAVSFIEVTERRLRKHSQDAAERRLLALTEHARDIIMVASPDGAIQYVSGGVRNSLGYLLAETQRAAQMGAWEYSYVTRELTWTEEMFRIYETRASEFELSWESMRARCVPESAQRLREACARAEASGTPMDLELEIMTLKDQRIWVRMLGHVESLEGRPFRAFGSVQNVQAQKLAQIAMQNSQGWLRLSMGMAHMHAWRWDRATDSFEFALDDGRQVHLPSVFPGMQELIARVHPVDRPAVSGAIDVAFETRAEVQREFRVQTNEGRYRWYAAVARPLFDINGLPRGLVGVIQDITARRDSELRLRRSEELLRATTANAADTLMLVDTGLRVRFINKSVGGLEMEEIIGGEIGVLLPESAREGVLEKLRTLLYSGGTATYEFESVKGDRVRYFENRAVLVRDDGIGTGISISTRDITERKRLEQEILDISGRERQSIGRDLHDGLGQELTGVALMLRGLAARVRGCCPEAVESVNEIVRVVNQSIENARSLARGLLPVRTETGGLACALRELASRSRDLYGLEVRFRAEVWPELTLDETDASHLYRIAQEALTNSARHGHATTVEIFLLVARNTFLLRITDNGEGFREPTSPYKGMGLKIMKYRADMIGADFEIAPHEPGGTVVRVRGEQPAATAHVHPADAS
jgi:PAS domain S-box-containing protein